MLPPEVPGAGALLCTGMTGCSPNQRESKPNVSAFCATTATSIGCGPGNNETQMFMADSFSPGKRCRDTRGLRSARTGVSYARGYGIIPHYNAPDVRVCHLHRDGL